MLAKKFGRKNCGSSELRQLRHVRGQLRLRVAPREVRVGLAEAGLREHRHQRRARERLGQEDRLRVRALHLGDQPLPEADRLRVRVVDPEHRDALVDPVQHDVAERAPERAPVVGVEVDVVDVLVLLGRVLGVLERAVGPPVEPVRMLLQPRVVGEHWIAKSSAIAIPASRAAATRLANSSALPRSGCRASCPPASAPIAHGLPGSERRAVGELLRPLRCERPMGWIGRQVEHVEAELGELGQLLLDTCEAAPRAREELVPGAVGRALGIDDELERLLGDRRARSGRRRRRRVPPRPSARGRRAAPPPRTARSRDRSGRRRPCARARAARTRRGRPTATTPNCQRPSASTVNEPCQRSGSSRSAVIGTSRQRRAPARR